MGQVARYVGVAQDITDRKKGEEDLRESEERFRRLFEQSPIGISITGIDRHYLKVNESFCRILGYSEQELSKMTIDDLSCPEELKQELVLRDMVRGNEIPSYTLDKRIFRKKGQAAWVRVTATTIRDPEGNGLYGMGMLEDINATKELERETYGFSCHGFPVASAS